MADIDASVDQLVDAGLLTERQAQAYVLREIELVPRDGAAQFMGIQPSTLDDYRRDAVDKIEAAEATLGAINELRHEPLPEECAECGAALGGQWTQNDHGNPICLECGGVDSDESS